LSFDLLPTTGQNKAPLPLQLDIDGCTDEPCRVKQVGKIHFELEFVARKLENIKSWGKTIVFFLFIAHETKKLTALVEAYLGDVKLPFEMPKALTNACGVGLQNAKCPIDQLQVVRYHLSAPVNAPVADVTVTLEFSLMDENRDVVSCVRVDVRLVK
jgi:ML domain